MCFYSQNVLRGWGGEVELIKLIMNWPMFAYTLLNALYIFCVCACDVYTESKGICFYEKLYNYYD